MTTIRTVRVVNEETDPDKISAQIAVYSKQLEKEQRHLNLMMNFFATVSLVIALIGGYFMTEGQWLVVIILIAAYIFTKVCARRWAFFQIASVQDIAASIEFSYIQLTKVGFSQAIRKSQLHDFSKPRTSSPKS